MRKNLKRFYYAINILMMLFKSQMKYIAFAILFLLSVTECNAQYGFLKNMDVELWDGICIPAFKYNDGRNRIGMSLGANFHYNFENRPWDCGIFIQLDQARRKIDEMKSNNKTASFGLLGSYNFNNRNNINPFISIGIGAGYNRQDNNGENMFRSRWAMVINPKIGVEFSRLLRLNLYFQLSRKYYSTMGLSLGLTFGKRQ